MGFKLEMELEHGKQRSWCAAELHVRAQAKGWMGMAEGAHCRAAAGVGCCPALSGARRWYSLLGGEADETAEDALGFLSFHSLPAQEGDAGLELAGEGQACF